MYRFCLLSQHLLIKNDWWRINGRTSCYSIPFNLWSLIKKLQIEVDSASRQVWRNVARRQHLPWQYFNFNGLTCFLSDLTMMFINCSFILDKVLNLWNLVHFLSTLTPWGDGVKRKRRKSQDKIYSLRIHGKTLGLDKDVSWEWKVPGALSCQVFFSRVNCSKLFSVLFYLWPNTNIGLLQDYRNGLLRLNGLYIYWFWTVSKTLISDFCLKARFEIANKSWPGIKVV
jgi:hypothetical protein